MERRVFLGLAVKVGGGLVAGAVAAVPITTLLSPVLRRRAASEWVEVGPVGEFAVGEVRQAVVQVPRADWAQSLRARGVFVWRPESAGEEAALVVFSKACTDLGCPVTWDPGSGWYFCPCHGAIFDQEGAPRAGPPRKPLHRYLTRIQDGILQIDINSVPPWA